MKRGSFNLGVDLLAFLSLAGMMGSGYVLWVILPPELRHSHELWTLTASIWIRIHVAAGLVFAAVLFFHFLLHRAWILTKITRRPGAAPGWIVPAALLAMAAPFAIAAHLGVRKSVRTDTPEVPGDVGFEHDVRPILEKACSRCHTGGQAAGGFDIENREDYFTPRADETVPLVVQGNAAASKLYLVISRNDPATAGDRVHALPTDQVRVIQTWINQGAEWPED